MDRCWLAWVLGIVACDAGGKSGADSNANQMSASESGSSESGSSESGDPPTTGCVYTPTVLPNIDAIGITGVPASEVLAEAEGTFIGQIAWIDAAPLTYAGSMDPSALTLTISYAGGEIRSLEAEALDCGELEGCACEDRLEIDVTWRMTSADGVLDETWNAALVHEPRSWLFSKPVGIRREFQPDDTNGSLSAAAFGPPDGELDRLDAKVTFRNGAAQGAIDSILIWMGGAWGGPAAKFAALRDGVNEIACHELDVEGACEYTNCVPVIGYQQILDCQCAPFDNTFCFATAPDPDAPMTWYTHVDGDTWDQYDQVVALPSFGDVTPAPWTACVDAPEIPGCECATEAPACG